MIYAGLDGGGTQTTCRIVSAQGEILGEATAGGASLTHLEPEQVADHLAQAIHAALHEAPAAAGASQIAALCAGFASAGDPRRRGQYEEILRTLAPQARILVVTDAELALAGALAGEPGIVVISGTGSIALGCDAHGRRARAGGHGPGFSDEGSGYWIGREAVRRVVQASEGMGAVTQLREPLLAHWRARDEADLTAKLLDLGRAGQPVPYAALAPAVAQCAQAGDAAAGEILAAAGRELARLVMGVARQLQMPEPRVAGCGGILRHIEAVRASLTAALARDCPGARLISAQGSPLDGAMLLANPG